MYMYEGDLHEITKNGGGRSQTGNLLSLNEAFSPGIGLHIIELLSKGIPHKVTILPSL